MRMLFIDFSSAFSTIIPQQLTAKLSLMRLNSSNTITLSTGVPHGALFVLCGFVTPDLFDPDYRLTDFGFSACLIVSLLTHDCSSSSTMNNLMKFADNTTIMGLISINDDVIQRGGATAGRLVYSVDKGHKVTTAFWYLKGTLGQEPANILLNSSFQGRLKYLGDKEQNCGLRISDARENDSGIFDFLFKTNANEESQTSESGVNVTVTDFDVHVLPMKDVLTEGDWLILSCGRCIPTSFIPTYIWKKDGRPHATKQGNNILEMESVKMEDGGKYSCSKVKAQLDEVLNTLERKFDKSSESESENLASQASTVLNISETLVSLLVKPTNTEEILNFTSNTTEVKVYTVGPNATLESITRLNNTAAFLDIDIISIAKNNKGHASVAFMTYDNMSEILKPTFFPSKKDTVNTMMSTVVSAFLPKTTNKTLTNPVNFTLKHIRWSHRLELLNTIAVTVGLTLLSLAVLTLVLFRKNSRVSSVLRLNLCICLLLAHLLFLLTQRFLAHSNYKVLLCSAFAGILHFLLLSAFVWMFLEAITLFISVRNLSKIRSRWREVLHWKYQLVIGYVVPTLVVGVSVAVQRDGYDSETCWIKLGTSFVWSFLGPVCFILAVNLILFIAIIITLQCTLMHLSGDVSQIKTSRTMVFKALAQFFILGCPWILGFFTQFSKALEIIFLLLTSQQGTFIFLVHCVLSEEVKQNQVRKQYKKLWYILCPHHETKEQMTETMRTVQSNIYTTDADLSVDLDKKD
ncbi:adhesion G protein-coupled receptor E3-like [Chanos chanos]|uniref:Adhesion G protein-coupled receptor E3-like n=1 Tax=Chanos chanos TaxID=29144 RepID=A0A6J2VS00_CHACN|nr:adhesion G protein-coupled receptor E3-like [Chanos chanos]